MRFPATLARVGGTLGLLGATLAAPMALAAPFGLTHSVAGGRHLVYCYGTVSKVDDGDTVNVHLTSGCPGGKKGHLMVIRNASIQATEIQHRSSKAECWSKEGEKFVRNLMPHGHRVRLSSYYATLNSEDDGHGRHRYIKYVDSWINGQWVDVQSAEILAGDALYKQEPKESAHTSEYMRDEQAAMYDGLGMWGNPAHCSRKYDQGAQFKSWIVWKTNGPDRPATAYEEAFKVRNVGSSSVNLSHWAIRDASHRFGGGTQTNAAGQSTYMSLPAGTVLAPGQTLVIHPSHGRSNPARHVFFDNGYQIAAGAHAYFTNAAMGRGGRGAHPRSGAPGGSQLFLVDPAHDFRAWATYPCVYKCGMPAPLKIWANPGVNNRGHEYVRLTNHAHHSVSLSGDVVDMDGRTKNLTGRIPARATITIHCKGTGRGKGKGKSRSTQRNEYWDNVSHQLPNPGGTIWLRTARDVTVAKYSWGNSGTYNYYRQ